MLPVENPFIKGAVQHAQMVLGESNRALSTSAALLTACNDTVNAASSGNLQAALASAQNARNLAGQVNNSVQMLNYAIHNHFERASYVLGRIQARVNEVASVVQNARISSGLPSSPYLYATPPVWPTAAPWQYGTAPTWPATGTPLM